MAGRGTRDAGRGKRFSVGALAGLMMAILGSAEEHRLPNGVSVVVEPRPSTETVALRLVVGGGNLEDPPGRPGGSRLHAALLLRGTREKSGFALARAAEELGGRLTSSSAPAVETLSLTVPSANGEAALRLLAEILLRPRLEPADLEKEKDLLIGSLATQRDQPSTSRRDEVYRTVFPSHPLSRLALPSDSEVRAVGLEDVRALHRARLEGPRLAVVAVGNCGAAHVAALAQELFGAVPGDTAGTGTNGFRTLLLPHPQPLAADIFRRVSKRTTQPEMTIAFPTEGVSAAEQAAFALLTHILGGFQERLYEEIREKRGWAYSIDAAGENFPGAGLFEVTTGAKKEHLEDIARIVRGELARIASVSVSSQELLRAVRYRKTAEARRDATNAGRVAVLTEELLSGSPLSTYEERVARLAAVAPADIQALARRLFANRHVAVVTMY